jgi:hypothetical protein
MKDWRELSLFPPIFISKTPCSLARFPDFPWQEKRVAPLALIATPNVDAQFEDKVKKERKGQNYATG